jgi:hypothetical protein
VAGPPYCIDTSAMIAAWVERYMPETFESFWERIDELSRAGVLFAPEEVRLELRRPDELKKWAADRDGMFVDLADAAYQAAATDAVDFVRTECGRRGLLLRPGDFKADPFVVALARTRGATVVHEEKRAREANARPKLPNVCDQFGVKEISLREFILANGWKF